MSLKTVTKQLGLFNVSPALGSQSRVSIYCVELILSSLSFRKSALVADRLQVLAGLLEEGTRGKKLAQEMASLSQVSKVDRPLSLVGFQSGVFTICLCD